jgi:3-phenylpropionate/trans-cinnamate dioxygenase ferredoxin subunit
MSNTDAYKLAAADLPAAGTMKRIDAFGERILIANVDETLYAVADTCTHEDASLSLGALKGDTVACPLHGSRFCLRTGAALDEPAETPLTVFTVENKRDGVWIRARRPVDR